MRRSVGLVVVHGVGKQAPGETVAALGRSITSRAGAGSLHGLLAGRRPGRELAAPADPEVRLALEIPTPSGAVSVRLYEAYWADLTKHYTAWDLIRYRLWLLWTLAYPLRNLFAGRYRPAPLPFATFARSFIALAATGVAAHLSDLALRVVLSLPGLIGAERRIDRTILEYGGDVFRYVTSDRAPFLARFRDACARASVDNAEVQVLGHSLGSVIAYDALTGGALSAEEMGKLTVLHTWGSPLDKFYFVWPERLRFALDPMPPRPVRWIHWHGRLDPIGGRLDFFNRVAGLGPPANCFCGGAASFGAAHTGYWTNPQVIGSLLETLGVAPAAP